MNKVILSRPILKEILSVTNTKNFHEFFIKTSLDNLMKRKINTVLVLGANHVEAEGFIKYPFKKIVLSGISPPDEKTKEIMNIDRRVSYVKLNMEKVSLPPKSFDLIFAKEALHHVSRPILAFYEMLRVAKKAIIFIEPQESWFGNILNLFNLTSKYEKNQFGNQKFRDNFVYRWRKKEIVKLLNSYYLESDYKVNFSSCWMSNRFNGKFPSLVKFFNLLGWLLSFIPGSNGNHLICAILPGKNLPN